MFTPFTRALRAILIAKEGVLAQTSKMLTTDGTNRICELRRDDNGVWEFSVFSPTLDKTTQKDATADLTQAIYQAMRREMVLNSPLYQKAVRAAKAELENEGGR
jgi:hypothetical protein